MITGEHDRARRRADRPARAAACTRTPTRSPAAREDLPLDGPFEDGTLADALLEPTVIYVRAALELIRSDIAVHGLAHITGGGLLNLLRLNERVGFAIEDPLPVPPIIELVQRARRGLRRRGVGGLQHGLRLRRRRARRARGRGDRAARRPPPRHPPDRHRHRRGRPRAPGVPAPPRLRPRSHSSGQGSRSPASGRRVALGRHVRLGRKPGLGFGRAGTLSSRRFLRSQSSRTSAISSPSRSERSSS